MDLKLLGWEKYSQKVKEDFDPQNTARVAIENKGSYLLYSNFGRLEGIIQGKFIKQTNSEADFPKVGDWVEIEKLNGEQKAIIKKILPRVSKLSRQRISKDKSEMHQKQEEQIMAANVDIVFVVQGLDGDYNLARLKRYLEAAQNGGCEAIILLNKCDLVADVSEKILEVKEKFPESKLFLVSGKTGYSINALRMLIAEGDSIVFVGSSGVGKSTLINKLLQDEMQKTQEVRSADSKGRHTTTKRELFLLPEGGVLIDTPGIRELMPWDQQKDRVKKPDKLSRKFIKAKNKYDESDE